MSMVLLDLPFFQIIFSQLALFKGGCERYGLQWDGGFVMSCNPELHAVQDGDCFHGNR